MDSLGYVRICRNRYVGMVNCLVTVVCRSDNYGLLSYQYRRIEIPMYLPKFSQPEPLSSYAS